MLLNINKSDVLCKLNYVLLLSVIYKENNMKRIYITLFLIFVLFTGNTSYAEITYIHTDTLGNPIAESDENGNITSRSRYKPFG